MMSENISDDVSIYMDNGSTTMPDPKVVSAVADAFLHFGNPSSLHSQGRKAASLLDSSRKKLASVLNCLPEELIFTSGGTESNNLAIKGIALPAREKGRDHLITSAIEHPSVLNVCRELEKQGFSLTILPVDSNGFVSPSNLSAAITDRTCLVSIMHANNEIGTIQPISQLAEICRSRGVKFHTDAVQSFTKVPIDLKDIDLVSVSAHKVHGPKGVGALYVKKGVSLLHQVVGGAQERRLRAGTENIPGIVGFAKAVSLASFDDTAKISLLSNRLINGLLAIPNTVLNGPKNSRLCNNVNVSFHFVEGESLLMHCDLKGLQVSTASACSSLELKASHVLLAIGLKEELAHTALRFTLSRYNTEEDVEAAIAIVSQVVGQLRSISPLREGVEFVGDDSCHHH